MKFAVEACPRQVLCCRGTPPGTWPTLRPTIQERDGGNQLLSTLAPCGSISNLIGMRPPVTPHVAGVAQAPHAFGMVGLGCLVIGCPPHQLRVCCRLPTKPPPASFKATKHLPPGLGFSFHVARICCEPPHRNFGVPGLRIARQDGGGWCPSPVLVRRGPSSALSSCPSLRSLPASRLADFGVVVKARTVDPLCFRCCAL